MVELTREVRVTIPLPTGQDAVPPPGSNTWAGWPPANRLRPFLCLRATVRGQVDERSGYLMDIRRIDEALRRAAGNCEPMADRPVDQAADAVWRALKSHWARPPELVALDLVPSPYTAFGIRLEEPGMVRITRSYEFAASHRLACKGFSDEQNQAMFGKCSNPNGHGHNYLLEVTVRKPAGPGPQESFSLPAMDSVVFSRVLERFDHKHLNDDCTEFADLNPSVENIARVIWEHLAGRIPDAELVNVGVWETAKTRADYSSSESDEFLRTRPG